MVWHSILNTFLTLSKIPFLIWTLTRQMGLGSIGGDKLDYSLIQHILVPTMCKNFSRYWDYISGGR